MVEKSKCACGCGEPVVRKRTGRAPLYASGACRVRALRKRRALEVIDGIAEFESLPDLASAVPVVVRTAATDEQVARSVLEARSIGFAFQRLGIQARPDLAWRCSKVGDAIISAIAEYFPDSKGRP